MMDFVDRAGWGARPPKGAYAGAVLDHGMAVHWEASPAPADHAQCPNAIRSVQNFHMDARGWLDIAYNWLVCTHGVIFEGRGWGHRSAAQGTDDGNNRWHAVCALGDQPDNFTREQRSGIVAVIAQCAQLGHGAGAVPHSWFHATDCPGDAIRGWVLAGFPDVDPVPRAPAPRPTPIATPQPSHPGFAAWSGRLLRNPTHGDDVRTWQAQMAHRGWRIAVDGDYGPASAAVAQAFQREKGLAVDGIVGPRTWDAAFITPIT